MHLPWDTKYLVFKFDFPPGAKKVVSTVMASGFRKQICYMKGGKCPVNWSINKKEKKPSLSLKEILSQTEDSGTFCRYIAINIQSPLNQMKREA